jgi:bifunctional UDP-N-acetylglucosamine pyrophosphorylase / glucosamine-1-phosphate N-acetyltransferase
MSGTRPTVIVLAAGQGTRMRSRWPKVLHAAAGRPLLDHVLRAARELDPETIAVVVGHGADAVRRRFADAGVTFVDQPQQRARAMRWPAARPRSRRAPARSSCSPATGRW